MSRVRAGVWIALGCLIASGCREVCSVDEIRSGDDCVPRPDASQERSDSAGDAGALDACIGAECEAACSGADCERDLCDPNPCQHRGACSHGDAGTTCDCTGTGFRGTYCEIGEIEDAATVPVASCQDQVGSCQHGGRCIEDANGFTCDCTGTGYGGTTCEVDPCDARPCGTGFTCNPAPSGTASCVATCASSELGCQLGDACGTDEECRSGGDSNASCDPTGKVCVTVCPTTSIVSELNLDAAKYCREIDGDLIVNPAFATIPAGALPYLKRIRGRFNADLSGVLNTSAKSLTFSAVRTIDGNLVLGLFRSATLLSFPQLTSVGGNVTIILAQSLERLSLPQLTTVQGKVEIGAMPVKQLDLGRLQTVGDTLTIGGVCDLPWSQISHLGSVVANALFSNIGCCTGQTTQHACDGACMCN